MTIARKVLLALAAMAGAIPAGAAPVDDLQQGDALVQTIGWKLARANARFCARNGPGIGLLLGDARTFNDAAAAREAYGLSGDISVAAVAEGGPAARAGLSANDTVLGFGDATVASEPAARPGAWTRQIRLQTRLETAVRTEGKVTLALAGDRSVTVTGEPACTVRFMLDDSKGYAKANREEVRIGRRFYDSTGDDEAAFAAIVAHEMAHAVLDHQGVLERGPRSVALVRHTEREADRLSVWLLANAGYNPQGAVRMIETVLRSKEPFLFPDPGHGGWKARREAVVAEIAAMKAAPEPDWPRFFKRET
jgi:hypothetical protein